MNRHLLFIAWTCTHLRTPRFIHLLLVCEQTKCEEFRGEMQERGLLQICQDLSSLFSTFLNIMSMLQNEMGDYCELGQSANVISQMIAQVCCFKKNLHVSLRVIYICSCFERSFLYLSSSHKTGRSIFITQRAHVHTPPGLLTPEIVLAHHEHHLCDWFLQYIK